MSREIRKQRDGDGMVWGVAPQKIPNYLTERKGSFDSGIVIPSLLMFSLKFH